MYLAATKVIPTNDYNLIITFENGETRRFDMNPYLHIGIFSELQDISKFKTAHIHFDTVEWDNEADIDPEILYANSIKYSE